MLTWFGEPCGSAARDGQHKGWQRHSQQNVLEAFTELAADIGPAFDVEVICLVNKLQQEKREPGPKRCEACPQQTGSQQEQGESRQDMKRVHADARSMLDEQFDLVPANNSHQPALSAMSLSCRTSSDALKRQP